MKGVVRLTVKYNYYADTMAGHTKEKPAGLFRAPTNNPLYLEALRGDGNWHFSPDLVRAFTSGDTLDIEEIDKATAEKAIKYIEGMLEVRNKKGHT